MHRWITSPTAPAGSSRRTWTPRRSPGASARPRTSIRRRRCWDTSTGFGRRWRGSAPWSASRSSPAATCTSFACWWRRDRGWTSSRRASWRVPTPPGARVSASSSPAWARATPKSPPPLVAPALREGPGGRALSTPSISSTSSHPPNSTPSPPSPGLCAPPRASPSASTRASTRGPTTTPRRAGRERSSASRRTRRSASSIAGAGTRGRGWRGCTCTWARPSARPRPTSRLCASRSTSSTPRPLAACRCARSTSGAGSAPTTSPAPPRRTPTTPPPSPPSFAIAWSAGWR
jgi:hypothetical protein